MYGYIKKNMNLLNNKAKSMLILKILLLLKLLLSAGNNYMFSKVQTISL